MFRFTIFCLFVPLLWASFSPKRPLKVFPSQAPGPRIFNGEQASAEQFPWQAALFIHNTSGSITFYCGGGIISKDWIVTAGHCVDRAAYMTVYTGFPASETAPTRTYTFVLYEEYDPNTLVHDIGLVKLENSLTFDLNTAAIPISSDNLIAGTSITVSGHGSISDEDPDVRTSLSYVNLVTIYNSACAQHYGCDAITGQMVCAISDTCEIKSPCLSDDGGPVVANGELVAVVSFVSDAGCESGAPSGYTRTTPYASWITQHTGV